MVARKLTAAPAARKSAKRTSTKGNAPAIIDVHTRDPAQFATNYFLSLM